MNVVPSTETNICKHSKMHRKYYLSKEREDFLGEEWSFHFQRTSKMRVMVMQTTMLKCLLG